MNFFEDLERLHFSQPHPALISIGSENCAYAPYHARGKNCYLLVGHVLSEDCFYGFWVGVSRDCTDCAFTEKSELCYECVDIRECYNCNFSQDCITCSDCDFCYDCKGCRNCFGCVNLRNKQFHIFNQAYPKEQYFEKVRALRQAQHDNVTVSLSNRQYGMGNPPDEFIHLKNTLPHIYLQGFQNENVIGNHIFHSKNVYMGFDVSEQEDTYYIYNSHHIKDCMDLNYSSIGTEQCYMCHSCVTGFNCNFCNLSWYSQNLDYCEFVFNSHDCFGCVSRSHAEYEILNKKYSKEEYFKRVAEIKDRLKKEGSYGRWWWPSPYGDIKPFSSYMA